MVLPLAELDVDDPVRPDLRDGRHASRLEGFTQALDEARRSGLGRARVLGEVASETGVDDELLAVVGFGELEEEDALCESDIDTLAKAAGHQKLKPARVR